MRRPTATAAVALALALVAAGCSGSSSGDGAADGQRATTTAVAATTTADPSDPASVPAEPSAGCGTKPDVARVDMDAVPGDVQQTFQSGGKERIYRLGVPPSYDPDVPAPLVVNLHGSGSNAVQASAYGDVPREAAKRGMLTVAPQALDGRWQLSGRGDDADFLAALVDDIEGRYCVDLNRVHLVGMSLGAWKAAATGCTEADRYASMALITVEVFPQKCRPIAVVAFHGRADHTVPYGEGATVDPAGSPNEGLPGTLVNIADWAKSGGCDPKPKIERIGDDVEHRTYRGCDPGVGVELYTIDGGGHTWPGASITIGPTTQTIDATQIALDWFEAHPRRRA